MIEKILLRLANGSQAIKDPKTAVLSPGAHCGITFNPGSCGDGCSSCAAVCPVRAISIPLAVDSGKCVLCGECVRTCGGNLLTFSADPGIASSSREGLFRKPGSDWNISDKVSARSDLKRIFERSLKLRSVSAGGCGACEMELNACGNANFDMARYGIEFTASPRHADGLVITGPVTSNMARALADTYDALPDPKLVILAGSCAISGGLFADTPDTDRSWLSKSGVDLYVPGCPPHPLTFIRGLLQLLGK